MEAKVWDINIRLKTDMYDTEEEIVSLVNNMINKLREDEVLFPSEGIFIADVREADLSDIEGLVDDRGDPDD